MSVFHRFVIPTEGWPGSPTSADFALVGVVQPERRDLLFVPSA